MVRSLFFFGIVLLLLPSCTFRSKAKTERMEAVVNEVRDRYRADEDISNDDQIFEAYDYFLHAKDYQNAASAATTPIHTIKTDSSRGHTKKRERSQRTTITATPAR